MNIRIPKELLIWIDNNRGDMSRYAFIIHHMVTLMNDSKMKNK